MPPNSRGFFRPREKSLIFLTLITFAFVCFGAIFFLPEKSSSYGNDVNGNSNRVYKVYKELRNAGHEFIIPPPPVDSGSVGFDNPNFRHGVIDRPDPHRVDDKAR